MAQSLMVGGVLAVCFIMYFAFGQQNFALFLLIAGVLMGAVLGISFGKVAGQSLPTVMKNFMNYSISPRIYLWRRKESAVYLSTKREAPKPKAASPTLSKNSPLKLRNEGKIEQMIKKIDFEKPPE